MAFRLTLILLLAIFGAMYLAPDAPPRPDRADRAPEAARSDPPAAVPDTRPAAPPQADTAGQPAPPPAAPLVPNAANRTPERAADAADTGPDTSPAAEAPADPVATADSDDGTGPVTLPGLVLSDPGDAAGGALSLSDAARTRAAEAARDAASDATTDLLRGLVGDLSPAAPTSPNPPPAGQPQPTDPLPPPVGDLARVTGTEVNLRAGPSTATAVVGRVTEGQTVRVLTPDRDGWSGIEDPASGDEVFIASRFLDVLR